MTRGFRAWLCVSVLATSSFATDVGGAITSDTTWNVAGSPYVVTSSVTVSNGATLTIDPGVVVRFRSATGLTLGTSTTGMLRAIGTAGSPIVLRADLPFPSPGYWNGILFSNTSASSVIERCTIEDAGAGTNDAAIRIASSTPAIRTTTVRRSDGYGIYVTGAGVSPELSSITYDSNTSYPLHIDVAGWPSPFSGGVFTANTQQAIEVAGGTIANDTLWPAFAVPYSIVSTITVQGTLAPTMTIQPGAVLRFRTSVSLNIGSSQLGKLLAQGTAGQPILLTSDKVTPAPGDWIGVRFGDLTLASSLMQSCTVEYAGQGPSQALDLFLCEPTLTSTTIRKCPQDGVVMNTCSPTLQSVTVADAGRYGVQVIGTSLPVMQGLSITNPANYGVYVNSASAGGALTGSVVANGVYFTGVTSMTVTGNTFSNYNAFPTRIEGDSVGEFLGNNTLQGVVAGTSVLEVLGDTLLRSATWPNVGLRYVILGAVVVAGPATPVLTLSPGVELRFAAGQSLTIGSNSGSTPGGLDAHGTVAQPILFTAHTPTPTAGFWGRVLFEDSATQTSIMERCTIEYAGNVTFGGGLYVDFSSPTLRNVTVRQSTQDGLVINQSNSTVESISIDACTRYGIQILGVHNATITGATITNVGNYGVFVNTASAAGTLSASNVANGIFFTGLTTMAVTGNTFSNYDAFPLRLEANSVGAFLASNVLTGVVPSTSRLEVLSDTIVQSATWPNVGVSYVILGVINVSSSVRPTLTLAPGTRLKFASAVTFSVGSGQPGALIAVGTPAQPILFTSNQTTPTAGFWGSVRFETSSLPTSRMEYCTLEYGSNSDSVLYVNGGAPTFKNVTLRFSLFDGLRLRGGTLATFENGAISSSGRYGIFIDGTTSPIVRTTVVTTPVNYGFYVSTASAGGKLESSDIENGIYFTGVSTMTVTGNTFRNYNAFPTRVGANSCGELFTANTFVGIVAGTSIAEVLSDTIVRSATWPSLGARYVVLGPITISSAASPVLTLSRGVEVRHTAGATWTVGSNSPTTPGGLIAAGTPAQPILFTAHTATPTAGFWGRILFEDSALPSSKLERCTVEYAGAVASVAQIYCDFCSPTLRNTTVRFSANDGVLVNGGNPTIDTVGIDSSARYGLQITGTSAPTITGLTVTNVTNYGVFVNTSSAGGSIAASNVDHSIQFTGLSTMTLGGNTFSTYNAWPARMGPKQVQGFLTGNTIQGVVPGTSTLEILADTLNQSSSWPASGIDYVFLGAVTLASPTTATWTLAPGAKLRFRTSTGLQIGQSGQPGVLIAQGTVPAPITFTTDNAAPAPGQWNGISYVNTTQASILERCNVLYGGQGGNAANVRYALGRPTMRSCSLQNSSTAGVSIAGGDPILEDNTISSNVTGISVGASAANTTRIANNDVTGNSTAGLANALTSGVDARLNWWGAASGPSGNGPGTGNAITGGSVLFEPWLGDPKSSTLTWTYANASPDPFSQNGGRTGFAATTNVAANWQITILNAAQTVVRTFTGSGSLVAIDWNGTDSGFSALPNGAYTYRFEGTAVAGGGTFPRAIGSIALDSTLAVAKIDLPDPQTMVTGSIPVTGSASGGNFVNYSVQYGVGYTPSSWTNLVTSTTQVANGSLTTWAVSTSLTNSIYTLRVIVTMTGGATIEDRVATRLLKVVSLSAAPAAFSPNGDGTIDTATVTGALAAPANWSLTFLDSGSSVVRTFNGSGDALSVAWDGRNTGGTVVPDGNYNYTLLASDPDSALTNSSGSVTPLKVDTTVPTLQITAPTRMQTILSSQNFTVRGQATDANFASLTLSVGAGIPAQTFTQIASSTTPVTGIPPADVLGTWIVNQFTPGPYTLRLAASDSAGNATTFDRHALLDYIAISNVYAFPDVLDVTQGDDGTIYFTLNRPADASVRIYANPGATLVRTLAMPGLFSGDQQLVWDGRDDGGQFSSLYKANYVTITASDSFGRDGSYNSPASPIQAALGAWGTTNINTTGFNAYRNDELAIQYAVSGWMSNQIFAQGTGMNRALTPFGIFPPGNFVTYWDGRITSGGSIYAGAFSFYFSVPNTAPASAFYLERPPLRFANFRAQAYLIHPTFGEVSDFEFDLSESAMVSIEILDPNGNHARTLYSNVALSPGAHSVEWDGRADSGKLVTTEGHYKIVLSASDALTGSVYQRFGSVTVYR